MPAPSVSVIVPTFNRAGYLPECLEAILSQTFSDWELIVVDDGSCDDTPRLLTQYGNQIRVIRQENRGVSAARNRGIEQSRGTYLAFCDSDDIWKKDKLQIQMELFQKDPTAVVCYTDEIWIRNGAHLNPKKRHQKLSGWIFEKCLELCIVSPSSVMMHRKFFEVAGLFDETMTVCEDYDLWLRASLLWPFHFIPRPLIIKRGGHEDQLSTRYWGMDRFRIQAIEKCLRNPLLQEPQRQQAIASLIHKCTILAAGARKRGHLQEAQKFETILHQWANQRS